MLRSRLLSTTMLSGALGGAFLVAGSAQGADIYGKAPIGPPATFMPAVDGVNWNVSSFGGSIAGRSAYGSEGAVSIPLAGMYGLQIDGGLGSYASRAVGSIGGHLFWRDPNIGLFGLYLNHTHWNRFGGVHVSMAAGEAEYYWGRVTLQGIAGVEWGNSVSNTTFNASVVPPAVPVPGIATTNTFIETYDVKTRFFDQINLKYYVTDDWSVLVGHRYQGGKNALALGTEYALPMRGNMLATAFVEGRIGEGDFQGVWGGLKVYWGQKSKPLIARQRQDDPIVWGAMSSLFSIINQNLKLGTGASSLFCPTTGETQLDGMVCESPGGES